MQQSEGICGSGAWYLPGNTRRTVFLIKFELIIPLELTKIRILNYSITNWFLFFSFYFEDQVLAGGNITLAGVPLSSPVPLTAT